VFSVDVPTGQPESSGGEGFEDDPTGDSCPLSDGLNSFVLQSHTHTDLKPQPLELQQKVIGGQCTSRQPAVTLTSDHQNQIGSSVRARGYSW